MTKQPTPAATPQTCAFVSGRRGRAASCILSVYVRLPPTPRQQHRAMENYLREWRQEALNRCQYDTAIFVADKLLALTGMLLRSLHHGCNASMLTTAHRR
jgi:hypothetical protein